MKLDKHPLAVNVLKFQYYNFDFFSCQEIVLFETLVVVGGISFKKKDEFFHSTQTLSDKTGIKKHSINKIIKRFDELNIINIKVKGMPRVKFFILNWDQIIELLPQIYQFDEVAKLFKGSSKPLLDFYKLLAENNKEKIQKKPLKMTSLIFTLGTLRNLKLSKSQEKQDRITSCNLISHN